MFDNFLKERKETSRKFHAGQNILSTTFISFSLSCRSWSPNYSVLVSLAAMHVPMVSREGTAKVVDCAGDAPIGRSDISTLEIGTGADDRDTLPADEPWVVAPDEFSAPPVLFDAFPEQREGKTPGLPAPVFLGRQSGASTQDWTYGKKNLIRMNMCSTLSSTDTGSLLK
jgi:hypothetical protein